MKNSGVKYWLDLLQKLKKENEELRLANAKLEADIEEKLNEELLRRTNEKT